MTLSLCVVVVTRDRPEDVRRLLNSVEGQSRLPEKVVFVDSSEVSCLGEIAREVLGNKVAKIEVILRKCTLPEGRNLGASHAGTDLISFLDDDVVLEPDYFSTVVSFLEGDESGRVGGLEGEVTNFPTWKDFRWSSRLPINAIFFMNLPGRGYYRQSGMARHVVRSKGPVRTEVLSGSNMTFRGTVLAEIKFDESLKGRSHEDLDYSRRVSLKYAMYHLPAAKLLHLETPKARATSAVAAESAVRNPRALLEKNFEMTRKRRLAFNMSLIGQLIHLVIARRVDDIKPFLLEVFRG